ncbi:MAG: hypothetical protein ACI8V4_001632 [Ilumatobacter sp.]|jgi:hypothetical protein
MRAWSPAQNARADVARLWPSDDLVGGWARSSMVGVPLGRTTAHPYS